MLTLLLQICDSAFPNGAFSHSFGLESYVNENLIKDEKTAFCYLQRNLFSNFLHFELLGIKLALKYANDDKKLRSLQREFLSSTLALEQCKAYVFLAKRFVKNVNLLKLQTPCLNAYLKENQNPIYPFVYALFCKDNDLNFIYESFLFSSFSHLVTILVKIVPLSQNEGQILLFSLQKEFKIALKKLENLDEKDWCLNKNIINDILCIKHKNLAFKMYIS